MYEDLLPITEGVLKLSSLLRNQWTCACSMVGFPLTLLLLGIPFNLASALHFRYLVSVVLLVHI